MIVFLLQTLIIIALPTALFRLAGLRRVVPLVVLQILFGLALGPSLLGRLSPETYSMLFAPAALGPLSGIEPLPEWKVTAWTDLIATLYRPQDR